MGVYTCPDFENNQPLVIYIAIYNLEQHIAALIAFYCSNLGHDASKTAVGASNFSGKTLNLFSLLRLNGAL